MSSPEFDSVKAEKADAIRRYNRNRTFISSFHRLITVVALLCSFPYFPLLKEMISAFNKQLYVFFLINAMIFLIYRFSNLAAAESPPDLYDEYVSLSASGRSEKSADEETKSDVSASAEVQFQLPEEEKQIVVPAAAEEKIPIGDLAEAKEALPLRRTRSEKYATVVKEEARVRVLRRSETGIGRELAAGGGGERKSMEDMNSDEFRFTIERFIANKKKLLRDENFAAVMEERGTTFFTAVGT